MFQGSKHVPEDTYFRYLERVGASNVNGTTNTDRTNYFETVPKNRLELALWLESDRMGFLLDHVDEQTFAGQRDVVKNERRQNYENAPYGLVGQYVDEALYPPSHPYHHLTIGSPGRPRRGHARRRPALLPDVVRAQQRDARDRGRHRARVDAGARREVLRAHPRRGSAAARAGAARGARRRRLGSRSRRVSSCRASSSRGRRRPSSRRETRSSTFSPAP